MKNLELLNLEELNSGEVVLTMGGGVNLSDLTSHLPTLSVENLEKAAHVLKSVAACCSSILIIAAFVGL